MEERGAGRDGRVERELLRDVMQALFTCLLRVHGSELALEVALCRQSKGLGFQVQGLGVWGWGFGNTKA